MCSGTYVSIQPNVLTIVKSSQFVSSIFFLKGKLGRFFETIRTKINGDDNELCHFIAGNEDMKGLETLLASVQRLKGQFKEHSYTAGEAKYWERQIAVSDGKAVSWDARAYDFNQTLFFHWLGL